jgi:hypothetical protein
MSAALRMWDDPVAGEPTLVLAFEGWNDAGEAATAAARYLEKKADCRPLAEIDPEEFFDFTVTRPAVHLGNDGVRCIDWPAFRFSHGSASAECPLIVGVGHEPHLHWRAFEDEVVALASASRVRRVCLLGAFLADVLYSRPVRISGFASGAALMERLGIDTSGYEGPTGIVGVLGDRLRREGMEVVSLWAGLPHYIDASPNARGALALIEKTTQWLGAPVDESELRAAAGEFEERISALVASDPTLSDYVKQLKRRDFVQ